MATNADLKVEKSTQILANFYNSRHEDITVTLECANGTIKAHKSVLTSGSEYFAAIFNGDDEENRTNTVKSGETSMEVMEIIIKHLYNQDLPASSNISEELTRDLILEADKLQLTDLFEKYWNEFSAATPQNFILVWQLSHQLNKKETIGKIMTFIANSQKEITKNKIALNIDMSQLSVLITPDLINELTESQMIGLFNFILAWGSNKKSIKDEDVTSLLSKCGLKKLPMSFLSKIMKENNLTRSVKDLMNNEIIARRHELFKPQFFIRVIRVESHGVCTRRKFSLRDSTWLKRQDCKKTVRIEIVECFNQWFRFCDCDDIPTSIQLGYGRPKENVILRTTLFETANNYCAFFKLLDNKGYISVFRNREWCILEESFVDCTSKKLLLAMETKLYFDVNEYYIRIYDRLRNVGVLVDKPLGKWKCFDCPSKKIDICENLDTKIYFFNEKNQLLYFDVKTEIWQKDEMAIDSDINLKNVKFVNYNDASVIIPDSTSPGSKVLIYSLREKREIATIDDDFLNTASYKNYFDISLDG